MGTTEWREGAQRSLNLIAIVGSAAATMVVSSACSVKGKNKPRTTFHRYDRLRCFSACSSGVSILVPAFLVEGSAVLLIRRVEEASEQTGNTSAPFPARAAVPAVSEGHVGAAP